MLSKKIGTSYLKCLVCIMGLFIHFSIYGICANQKDSRGFSWVNGPSRTQGGGWIWFRGEASDSNYDLAYKRAEARAVDKLIVECGKIPTQAKFFERCNDSTDEATYAYVRLAIEKKFCNSRQPENDVLKKIHNKYLAQIENKELVCKKENSQKCYEKAVKAYNDIDIEEAIKISDKGCDLKDKKSCSYLVYLAHKNLISQSGKKVEIKKIIPYFINGYKTLCSLGHTYENCYNSLTYNIFLKELKGHTKNSDEKELLVEFKNLCLSEKDLRACPDYINASDFSEKRKIELLRKYCDLGGVESCINLDKRLTDPLISDAVWETSSEKKRKRYLKIFNLSKKPLSKACSLGSDKACRQLSYYKYFSGKLSLERYIKEEKKYCSKLSSGYDPTKIDKNQLFEACRNYSDLNRKKEGREPGDKPLLTACRLGDSKSCDLIEDLMKCKGNTSPECHWAKLRSAQ